MLSMSHDFFQFQRDCFPHSEETSKLWNDLVLKEEQDITKASDNFKFQEPNQKFKCTGKGSLLTPLEYFIMSPTLKMQLQENGSLLASFDNSSELFETGKYCVAFSDLPSPDVFYYDDDESTQQQFRALYYVCGNTKDIKEEIISIFYPVSIFLSCFFILLTLIFTIINEDMVSRGTGWMYGKLKIGFLINVLIAYLFAGVNHTLEYVDPEGEFKGSTACIVIGYIIQHTWVSFFCWTSAMALNITKRFNNLLSRQENNSNRVLILNILFAQGLPMILTLVTVLMDELGGCDQSLPNMGYFNCFLGEEFNPEKRFHELSIFFYYYLIISVLLVFNVLCFIITGINLTMHWKSVQTLQTK